MNPILIAGPAVEPVALAEMRAFLRLDDTAEDELVAALIRTARECVEAKSGRRLIAQTWRIALDTWPGDRVVELPLSPLMAVESVRVFEADGAPITLAVSQYRVDASSDPACVVIDAAASVPAQPQGIEIEFRVGYGVAADAVPQPLRHAVRMLAAHWFENRGDEPDRAPAPDVLALIAPFRGARI